MGRWTYRFERTPDSGDPPIRARASVAIGPEEIAAIIDTIPDPFIALTGTLTPVAANAQARQLGLVSPAEEDHEVLGLAVLTSDLRRHAEGALATGIPSRFDWTHPGHGTVFDVLVYATHGLVSVHFRDASADRRAEQALGRSERRYREVVEHSFDVYALLLEDWTFVDLNQRWEELSGHPTSSLLGTRCLEQLLTVDSRALLTATIEQAEREGSLVVAHDVQLEARDGTMHTLEIGCRVEREPGERVLIQLVGRDVTESRDLAQRLQEAQKLEAVGRLAGGIAHDLNTVLLVIRGARTLLRERLEDEEDIELVDEIERETLRAGALIRQLLAFARRQVMQPTVIDLDEVVRDLVPMLGRLAGDAIALEVEYGAVPAIRGDRSQVEQVIVNLVANAAEAIEGTGSITIETGVRHLDAGTAPAWGEPAPGDHVTLVVRDTGSGLAPHLRARIFEPFFSTRGAENSGLGLSTVYGIVLQMHGGIDLESEVGRGSTFSVYLPATLAQAALPATDASPKRAAGPRSARVGLNVLLVEDDSAARRMLERLLEGLGHDVVSAAGPAEAVDRVEAAQRGDGEAVDVVLTDVVMPGMSGVDLAGRLREVSPELPVIYMSGYSETTGALERRLGRGDALLEKPFGTADLVTAIDTVLEPR